MKNFAIINGNNFNEFRIIRLAVMQRKTFDQFQLKFIGLVYKTFFTGIWGEMPFNNFLRNKKSRFLRSRNVCGSVWCRRYMLLSLSYPGPVSLIGVKMKKSRGGGLPPCTIRLRSRSLLSRYSVFQRISKGFQPVTKQHIPSLCMYVCLSSEPQGLMYSDF